MSSSVRRSTIQVALVAATCCIALMAMGFKVANSIWPAPGPGDRHALEILELNVKHYQRIVLPIIAICVGGLVGILRPHSPLAATLLGILPLAVVVFAGAFVEGFIWFVTYWVMAILAGRLTGSLINTVLVKNASSGGTRP